MRLASWSSIALLFCASEALAQYQCEDNPVVLPHETWGPHEAASADELYRRAREAAEHWSDDPALITSAHQALTHLLAIEPNAERGYVQLARLAMDAGNTSRYTLVPEAYDLAHDALLRAFELNPESAEAWMLLGAFKQLSRLGPESRLSGADREQAADALRQAERVGAKNPRLALNWADWYAHHFELDVAAQYVEQALAVPDLNARSAGIAYRKLAEYYRIQRRPAPAKRALENALAAEPRNPWNWIEYSALLLEERTDTRGAIAAARRALCLYPLPQANRRLAYALYFDWARDNVGKPQPLLDPRATEAYERHSNWRDVMGYAAEHEGLAALVEVLVTIGAPVDEADPHNHLSALYKAVRDGRVEDAERLIGLGADVNQVHKVWGPLLSVATGANLDMMRLLLAHGADVNVQWTDGTALLHAIGSGNVRMIELLLSAGADPNLTDDRGEPPLARAATNVLSDDSMKIVKLLLEAGADPLQEYPPGQSTLESARQMGTPEVAALLEEWVRKRGNFAQR